MSRQLETIGDTPYKPTSDADRAPSIPSVSHIKNKMKRAEVLAKLRRAHFKTQLAKRKRQKEEREELRKQGIEPARKVPRTIENTRIRDERTVARDDVETLQDEAVDELSTYFAGKQPKILITTNTHPSKVKNTPVTSNVLRFVFRELRPIFPTATAYKRRQFQLRDILRFAENRDFTDVIVVNEDFKTPSGLLLIHLPDGPTAYFRLTSIRTRKQLGDDLAHTVGKNPELILNNFTTRLGHSVGRMFAALFPQNPEFRSRRVITLHNQRDFIFFRQHRYIFEEQKDKKLKDKEPVICRLQECGPRFTLKLIYMQSGVFDGDRGDFEYKRLREKSRLSFVL